MDLNLSGLGNALPSALKPVVDAVTVVRTGTTDQIASFLRGNPDQRGAIETALASSGRAGDLSSIIERASAPLSTASHAVGRTVSDIVSAAGRGVGTSTIARAIQSTVADLPSRSGPAAGNVMAGAARTVADLSGRAAAIGGDIAGRIATAGGEAARGPVDAGRALLSEAMRSAVALPRPATDARGIALDGAPVSRAGDMIAATMREVRPGEVVAVALKEGRLAELVTDARAAGRLGDLVVSGRSIDGALAAFAAKGGLSVTELALFARSGLISPSDVHALRAAGVPVDVDEASTFIAPRDGPAEARLDTDSVVADGIAVAGFADASLAGFDAGAIRIGSRAAFEIYGVLGPPGSMVIAADSFEGIVRDADGDIATIERRLGLEAGVLSDPDSFIALIDRRDLIGLRLAETLSAWMPGGTVPSALTDLIRGTPFREVTLAA